MYKGLLCYDGTNYFGWQKTAFGPSIQEEIEKAIFHITGEKVTPEAASRTDRGVHARGQVIQFALEKAKEPKSLLRGLNAVLPPDIRLLDIMACEFHPTLDAIVKEYHYLLCLNSVQSPMERLYSWHIPQPLDIGKIEKAIPFLLGTQDFSAFANEQEKNPMCTLDSIYLNGDHFQIQGNRFLYKMVRNIVGTLVDIGKKGLPADYIPALLASRDRKKAGVTAPARGLYLHQVHYSSK